jgi:glycosyltransferase involved in cell wall biosynthesis
VTDPLVSVVIPTFNRAHHLPDAVASVLRQSEARWELILADDGSTDATGEYLATLHDPRIRVLRLEHVGHPGEVRNRALEICRAPYVAFLDSDDWWESGKLAAQLASLESRPDCRWSYTSFRVVYPGSDQAAIVRVPPAGDGGKVIEAVVAGTAGIVTSTVMVSRVLLQEAGRFDPAVTVGSDLDMWIRIAYLSRPAPVAEVLATRRQHAGSYMLGHADSIAVLDRVNDRLLARVDSARLRRIIRIRRLKWLIGAADRRRGEGRYRPAWEALSAALPGGLVSAGWWRAVARLLAESLAPAALVTWYRRR